MKLFTTSSRWLTVIALALVILLGGCQTHSASSLSPAQIAVLKSNGFTLSEEGWGLDLSGKILFGFAEDEISPASREYIARLTRALLDTGLSTLRIDGHTDNIGDATYNINLSKRRAAAVANAMIDAGMPEHSLHSRGLGDSKPVGDNHTREGRSQNRRVSIIITSF